MIEKTAETRRRLLQQTALAAGAAFLAKTSQAQEPASGAAQSAWAKFFPAGFKNEQVKTSGATINVVTGGDGPPVLMMHGAPQSLITWRLIAADLAKTNRLIMMDLRGYGDSSKPEGGQNHVDYSKRNMALDGVEVMKHYGITKFPVIGHDRGGRVGHRMALDHPDSVTRLAVLDIVPTHYLYTHVNIQFVQAYFHWFNYLRAAPGPENELLAQNTGRGGKGPQSDVNAEYARHTTNPAMIHAMCEDYRAGASIDLEHDDADRKAGKKVKCPLTSLWAGNGAMGRIYDVLAIWKEYGSKVSGKGLPPPAGHSLQESSPKETLAELQAFLKA
jgi:haloacetate dehalogenase